MRAALALACAVAVVTLPGDCAASSMVVAEVGNAKITQAFVSHWIVLLADKRRVPDAPRYADCVARRERLEPQAIVGALKEECAREYDGLARRALEFLISAIWLRGEAAERGLAPSDNEVDRDSAAGALLLSGHATAVDRRLVAEAELDAKRIRRALTSRQPLLTYAEEARFYRRHIARYERPDRRFIDIVEGLPTESAARSALRMLAAGESVNDHVLHESFDRIPVAHRLAATRPIMHAIFAARRYEPIGPLPLNHHYAVAVVTKIVPRAIRSLSDVRASIESRLRDEAQRRVLERFVASWGRKWRGRTSCSAGYVVRGCRQSRGTALPPQ
jgi:hypothetical protein